MSDWELEKAGEKLEQMIDAAQHQGPQMIVRDGNRVSVLLSMDDYKKLQHRKGKLTEFMRKSPMAGIDIDLSRDNTPLR